MACRHFDGQVVRLEQLADVADQFVRVRLTRIDELDLNLFDFDYDLTFTAFFMTDREQVYARYGGRDATDPDSRQSLAGLRSTMLSVLAMHAGEEKDFAPKAQEAPKYLRDVTGGRRGGHCLHCHQVKERLNADLERKGLWTREQAWRYPLPENLGFTLDVDRGNAVKAVAERSPAAAAGLRAGDVLTRLHGVPVHSLADAQYALDRAPTAGSIPVTWQRDGQPADGRLTLPPDWRRGDISWRPSLQHLIPSARLYGTDLTPDEKQALGLSPRQLAFREKGPLSTQARNAGIQPGDVIVGLDDQSLDTDADGFLRYVNSHYLVGDRVTIHVLRDGKRLSLPMTLRRGY